MSFLATGSVSGAAQRYGAAGDGRDGGYKKAMLDHAKNKSQKCVASKLSFSNTYIRQGTI